MCHHKLPGVKAIDVIYMLPWAVLNLLLKVTKNYVDFTFFITCVLFCIINKVLHHFINQSDTKPKSI